MKVLHWLLEDDAPGVACLARTRLLGESAGSRRVAALRRRCNEYPPVARMLERIDDAIAAGNYQKYEGAHWTLIFLADMLAEPPSTKDQRVKRLCDHVLSSQLDEGGFSPSGTPRYEIVCLTANLLRTLVHFGYGDDPRIVRGYERLAERILPHNGVPCIALEGSLHTACKMVLPQTLRCLAAAPPRASKSRMKQLRDLVIRQMLAVRVYQYFRPDAAAFHEARTHRPKGVSEHTIRLQWIESHTVPDDQLVAKPSWKRFGFPRSYNPDLLEGMLALAEAGAGYDRAMDDALEHIESKRLKDGRWKMEDSLNGKLLANVEQKGRPSKWVTLRAMIVLKHFGHVRA